MQRVSTAVQKSGERPIKVGRGDLKESGKVSALLFCWDSGFVNLGMLKFATIIIKMYDDYRKTVGSIISLFSSMYMCDLQKSSSYIKVSKGVD